MIATVLELCNVYIVPTVNIPMIGTDTFQLIKIEDGLLEGEVLYHELITKTEEEKLLIQKKREKKRKLKEKRKKIQEENKMKKEVKKQEHKEKSLHGIKKRSENEILMQKIAKESQDQNKSDEDDDAQYYRDELGEEPDKGIHLFIANFFFFFNIGLNRIFYK